MITMISKISKTIDIICIKVSILNWIMLIILGKSYIIHTLSDNQLSKYLKHVLTIMCKRTLMWVKDHRNGPRDIKGFLPH